MGIYFLNDFKNSVKHDKIEKINIKEYCYIDIKDYAKYKSKLVEKFDDNLNLIKK